MALIRFSEVESDEEQPPSSKTGMGVGARIFSADGALARRLESIWALWNGDWGVPPVRAALHGRCNSVFVDIQGG